MLLLHIWRRQPGKFFCISTKARDNEWKDHFFKRSKLGEVMPFIEANKDKDLYWCPHGFSKPRRLKQYAEVPKLLWADLDPVNPRQLGDLMPSVAWESSPGRYAALWVLNDFMTEDINRRLTYFLKADPGGWDITQVLRIPNTTNYKYTSTPKTKLLWQDGPSYDLKQIEDRLPKQRVEKSSNDNVAAGLYKKYERKLSGWVRRQLFKGKPKQGKRSEVLWRLANELMEAGCSREEAFELLRVSPWNKFKKRRNGDEQLKRELDKIVTQHFHVDNDEDPTVEPLDDDEVDEDDEPYQFLARPMSEVEEENIDWIWYPYLARGEVTILEGDPGLGKSYLAQMIAKGICDGEKLPTVKKGMPIVQGKVAYFDIENSMGSVTKKRLTGNSMKCLHNFFQEPEPFSIDDEDHMELVYEAIERLKPTLVVFDTINTYMGLADTHKASETQQTFRNFIDIARRFNCSVLVLRHLTKSTKEKALYRGQGSIAFVGLARVVLTVGQSPDDEDTRVMSVTKLNVAPHPKSLTFLIERLPDTLKERDRSRFVWGQFVDWSSDDIIASPKERKGEPKESIEPVVNWLRDALARGQMAFTQLMRMAGPRSFSEKMLYKAADELGVERKGEGMRTMWKLAHEG